MSSHRRPLAALLAVLTLGGCAPARPPLQTVPHLDVPRFMGEWFVIANIPYWLEDGKVASSDRYTLLPDGRIHTVFAFRRGSFTAPEETWEGTSWIPDATRPGEWQVRFWWPLTADYRLIELDADYRWAVIGHPGRNLGWILARERHLDADTLALIHARLPAHGYDPARFQMVPQP